MSCRYCDKRIAETLRSARRLADSAPQPCDREAASARVRAIIAMDDVCTCGEEDHQRRWLAVEELNRHPRYDRCHDDQSPWQELAVRAMEG